MSEQPTTPIYNNGQEPHRNVRVGTVVWGFILLAIAALFFAGAQADLSRFNPGVILAWTVIGVGVIAVIGGIVAAVVRKR